ncbi:MAG: hypothetical protein Tsb005_20690 [Gammaproteobacteria bacterium]
MLTVATITTIIILLFATAAIVHAICKYIKFPFAVGLVIAGILLNYIQHYVFISEQSLLTHLVSPHLILYVCLPTLLFESALHLDCKQLKQNMIPILALAIPGLLISTGVIGWIIAYFTHMDLMHGLLLGAILSATDPTAVIALFKQLGAPKRLTVLVEGESLFNDATAIVTAKLIVGFILSQTLSTHPMNSAISYFLMEFCGGLLLGCVLAIVFGWIIGRIESDANIEISLTTILAYASFVIATDVMHVSGVMATVAAGLTMSSWGATKISPSIKQYLQQYWDFLAYIVNALIFLLVGLSVNLSALINAWLPLCIVIIAMLVSRAIVVYGLSSLITCFMPNNPIDLRYQTIMYWGGLRGAIALAIVLGLGSFNHVEFFTVLVTGAVLFTLLVQGLTIHKLVSCLGLDKQPLPDQLAQLEGQAMAVNYALQTVPQLEHSGFFSPRIAQELRAKCTIDAKTIHQTIEQLRSNELTEAKELNLLFLRCFAVERSAYYDMFAAGHLTEAAYRNLLDLVDAQIEGIRCTQEVQEFHQLRKSWRILQQYWWSWLPSLSWLEKIILSIQALKITRHYEVMWGLHQASQAVINYLQTDVMNQEKPQLVSEVLDKFKQWHATTQIHLNNFAEQFPEFVTGVQERLAERLVLLAEQQALNEQARTGVLPPSVAQQMKLELARKIFKSREKISTNIKLAPEQLLMHISLFKQASPTELKTLMSKLHLRAMVANEVIIQQGEMGDSLFIIARGVVQVYQQHHDQKKLVANLLAGDFFGEMALLFDEPRAATCIAVTPCVLYELHRRDLQKVISVCPNVEAAIARKAYERQKQINTI